MLLCSLCDVSILAMLQNWLFVKGVNLTTNTFYHQYYITSLSSIRHTRVDYRLFLKS